MRAEIAALVLSLTGAGGAWAQANVVDVLVVTAQPKPEAKPGPVWWRVADADTTIYVLGLPGAEPGERAFDTALLKQRLESAFTVLTAPVVRAGLDGPPQVPSVSADQDGWTAVPPELAARLQRAWNQAGTGEGPRPMTALIGLSGRAGRAPDPACRGEGHDTVDWREGRPPAFVAAPRPVGRCQSAQPGMGEMIARMTDAEADALQGLLRMPGHAVAIYPARGLIMPGGVFEKLRARGIAVERES